MYPWKDFVEVLLFLLIEQMQDLIDLIYSLVNQLESLAKVIIAFASC